MPIDVDIVEASITGHLRNELEWVAAHTAHLSQPSSMLLRRSYFECFNQLKLENRLEKLV